VEKANKILIDKYRDQVGTIEKTFSETQYEYNNKTYSEKYGNYLEKQPISYINHKSMLKDVSNLVELDIYLSGIFN